MPIARSTEPVNVSRCPQLHTDSVDDHVIPRNKVLFEGIVIADLNPVYTLPPRSSARSSRFTVPVTLPDELHATSLTD
jgi:hypothetical protein